MYRFIAGRMSRMELLKTTSHSSDNLFDALSNEGYSDDETEIYSVDDESVRTTWADALTAGPPDAISLQYEACLLNVGSSIVFSFRVDMDM